MLRDVAQHIAEEKQNRLIVTEMREHLSMLADMHNGITPDEHRTLFDWWREEVARRKLRADRWEKAKQTVIGYLIITIMGAVVSFGQPLGKIVLEKWQNWITK
ncbi:MAG: hypothetical protein IPM06_17845 [Rhizobiales bacterium]|nr:hypothetical protein [Hyphomicrobiales bacterium]